jgi:hypothetical protein
VIEYNRLFKEWKDINGLGCSYTGRVMINGKTLFCIPDKTYNQVKRKIHPKDKTPETLPKVLASLKYQPLTRR